MRTDAANVTIIGRVAGHPTVTATNGGERLSMRVVSTERRYDEGTGEWSDGDEFGVTVVGWRRVSAGVISHVRKGDPVVVIGRISTRRFEREGGSIDYYTDVKADLVALDVARMNGRFSRHDPDRSAQPARQVDRDQTEEDGDSPAQAPTPAEASEQFLTATTLAEAARPLVPAS